MHYFAYIFLFFFSFFPLDEKGMYDPCLECFAVEDCFILFTHRKMPAFFSLSASLYIA